ncbi:MAG: ATP synthase F0 subunit C [Gemmataceae bacterium]
MRHAYSLLAAMVFVFSLAVPASASDTIAPLGMGLSVIGAGIGLGLIGIGAMNGIARQPEQAGNIRTAMLIIGGLVEGAAILGLVFCFVAK